MNKRLALVSAVFFVLAAVVQFVYVGVIEPQAQLDIRQASEAGLTTPRTIAVLLKDTEQKICIIFALFCALLMGERCWRIYNQRYLFDVDLFASDKDQQRPSLEQLESLQDDIRESPLVKTMIASIRRFDATKNVQNAADVIDSNIESTGMKLEAENSMIKYFIWAIPSIGFVGTVRGIGMALAEADKALNGDLAAVTELLGVAFNSTLVALMLSIALTALLHVLQNQQDQLILNIEDYCDRYLVKRLTPDHGIGPA